MTTVEPARPSIHVNNSPPLGERRRDGDKDEEQYDDDYAPTDPGEEQVNVDDVEDGALLA